MTGLLLAVGYAVLHGSIAIVLDISGVGTGGVPALPAVIPAALMSWLLLAGRAPRTSVWRLLSMGCLTISISVLITIAAIVTVSIGHFDHGAMLRMTMSVLPRALVIYGTGAALLTLLYGLTLRLILLRPDELRKLSR